MNADNYTDYASALVDIPVTVGDLTELSFTTQPAARTVTVGNTATFTAAAAGVPTPTYQWRVSTDGGASFTDIAGATGRTYTTAATTEEMNGWVYQCVAENSVDKAWSDVAVLTVQTPPVVITDPKDQAVPENTAVSFTAEASGVPDPEYQWQVKKENSDIWTDLPRETFETYTVKKATRDMNGYQYRCVVVNAAGSATSHAALLTVLYPPSFTSQPSDQSVTVGKSVTFTATADGNYAPEYRWEVKRATASDWEAIPGATGVSYTTEPADISMDANQYRCVATNSLGSDTTMVVTLTVQRADTGLKSVTVKNAHGSIRGTDIFVRLPYGSELPTDADDFEITPSGNATYTAPVSTDGGTTWTFTVTAEDGTTAEYTVSVTIAQDTHGTNIWLTVANPSMVRVSVTVPLSVGFAVVGTTDDTAAGAVTTENGNIILPNVRVKVDTPSTETTGGTYHLETVGSSKLVLRNYSTDVREESQIETDPPREGIEVEVRPSVFEVPDTIIEGVTRQHYWKPIGTDPTGDTSLFKRYRIGMNGMWMDTLTPMMVNGAYKDVYRLNGKLRLSAPDVATYGLTEGGTAKVAADTEFTMDVQVGGIQSQYRQVEESVKVGEIIWEITPVPLN